MVIFAILASGSGSRMGVSTPKQFLKLDDRCVLEHTVLNALSVSNIKKVILVISKDHRETAQALFKTEIEQGRIQIVYGGETRQESSYNLVKYLSERYPENTKLLIHDGARPFISKGLIKSHIKALDTYQAVNTIMPVTDTILSINNGQQTTLNRDQLRSVQTPQSFHLGRLLKAHKLARKNHYTDDIGLYQGQTPTDDIGFVEGEPNNFKITYEKDLKLAQFIVKNRQVKDTIKG